MEHLCFQGSLCMAIHASDSHPHFLISIPASVKECGFQNQTVSISPALLPTWGEGTDDFL